MRKILFLLLFILSSSAFAMNPESWRPGLHLFGGVGVNGSIYRSDRERQNQGPGLNFKTDLGYFINHAVAFEIGSQVKFNRVQEYFIWDTQFTLGVRARYKDMYTRGFYGRAPTVFFLDDAPRFYERKNATRIQYDGPVYGFAVGKMYKSEKGNIWFLESSLTYQELKQGRGVKQDGDISEVVFKDSTMIKIYGLQFNIGVMLF